MAPLTNTEKRELYSLPSMREERCGFPRPNNEWYAKNSSSGKADMNAFNRQKFITSYNIDAAEFYILQHYTVYAVSNIMAKKVIVDELGQYCLSTEIRL
jgi:hypothetical protein